MNISLTNKEIVKEVEETTNRTLKTVVDDKFSYLQDQTEATKQHIDVLSILQKMTNGDHRPQSTARLIL